MGELLLYEEALERAEKAEAERDYYKAQAEELLGKLEKAEAQVKQLEAERRSDALWIRFNTFQR